jgi:hypothetical protein
MRAFGEMAAAVCVASSLLVGCGGKSENLPGVPVPVPVPPGASATIDVSGATRGKATMTISLRRPCAIIRSCQ